MEKLLVEKETLKLVSSVPEGYELVELELALKEIEDGKLKFARKIGVDTEKGRGEKAKKEATLRNFISALGGLMADFAPKEDAQKVQEAVNEIAQICSASQRNGPKNTAIAQNADGKEVYVKLSSEREAGPYRQNLMGIYTKTSQTIKGCPVFKQIKEHEDDKQYYLFVGPHGYWRVGPDVTSHSGSVLKHPKRSGKIPPINGWLYYFDDKWNEDESLRVAYHVKYEKDMDDTVKFSSKRGNLQDELYRIGTFYRTMQIVQGCPVYESTIEKQDDEEPTHVYLYVSPDGYWGLGLDVAATHKCLKHPKKGAELPPKTGWLSGGEKWRRDSTIQLISNKEVTGVSQLNATQQMKVPGSCDCIIDYRFFPEIFWSGAPFKNITCLGIAVLRYDIEAVKTSLTKGCDVNFDKTSYVDLGEGLTPLMLACQYSTLPVISLLLKHPGIELDKRSSKGETALTRAIWSTFYKSEYEMDWKDNVDRIKLLVEAGANIDLLNEKGYSYLYEAEDRNDTKDGDMQEAVDYLRSKGVKSCGLFAFQRCNMHTHDNDQSEVEKECDCTLVEEFQLSGENVPKLENLSCLALAVIQNNIDAVETSLNKGCNVNFDKAKRSGKEGWTPFMLACEHSSLDIVSLLVRQPGIEIDRKSKESYEVALNWAVRRNDNLDMVKLLIEAGADPGIRSSGGVSHLHQAAYSGQLEILKYLHSQGAYINTEDSKLTTPLWVAAKYGHLEMVKYLANQGATLDTPRAKDGFCPLNVAVAEANVEVVKFLLKEGADVDKEYKEMQGCTNDGSMSNLEIAQMKLNDTETKPENKILYEEIITVLKEYGAMEPEELAKAINQLILETMDIIMRTWAEKNDVADPAFPSWEWLGSKKMPHCIKKLQDMTKHPRQWLAMVRSLVDVVPIEHPLGSIVIALLIKRTPMHIGLKKTLKSWNKKVNVDTYLKVFKMTTSFDEDDSRHRNMSIILSCIAGCIKNFWGERSVHKGDISKLFLTGDMLRYLFDNLKPGSDPEVSLFSLLALEFLASKLYGADCKNEEIVRDHFTELFSPTEHPLLRLEKMMESENWIEKQVGFCAQWYLDNLWTIDNQDARSLQKNNNINTTLVASEKSDNLKIGSNGLELRCDAPWFDTAMSTLQVNEGSWYYEVTIVTGGFMQIGWATLWSKFFEFQGYGVGDDEFSEAYDGCRQVVWYNRQQVESPKPHGWNPQGQAPINSWKPGDVVGSLIDIEHEEIVFSLNGVIISPEPYKHVFEKVKAGFFAAVSLMSFQQCQVNFGSDPFKHPPQGKPFKPLNEATCKSEFDFFPDERGGSGSDD